jgi:caffeoyl-CoA O-methyltransferase
MATVSRKFALDPAVAEYLVTHSSSPDDVQQSLIDETRRSMRDSAFMQVGPEVGTLLTLLATLIGARTAVDVGTFTGYSALCIAYGLAPDGTVLTCDTDDRGLPVAERAWEAAGVRPKIEFAPGSAVDTVRKLPPDPVIDLVFLDGAKPYYPLLFDEFVPRLRGGGLMLADNVLWSGKVVDTDHDDDWTDAIRRFNDKAVADPRVDNVMLGHIDGIMLIRKRV